jgi:hypothetical protein
VKRVFAALAVLALTSCGLFAGSEPDAATAMRGLEKACEVLPLLPDKAQTKEAVAACDALKKAKTICTDVVAPPPALGNRVVDAGVGGAGGSDSQ